MSTQGNESGSSTVRIGREVEKYARNPDDILGEVRKFRNELDSRIEEVVRDSEEGIENTLIGHRKNPAVYPVFTPHETEVDEDRLLIALSISMFELANPSRNPLHEKLEGTRETKTGKTAEGLLKGHEKGNFDWSAKYEKSDNSLLINEFPEKILPPSREAPPILAYLWNGLNTGVDAGVDRNYGISMKTLEARIVHEMTHALNTQAAKPLANEKTAAIDEAAAMASTYAVVGKMPDLHEYYVQAGINREDLKAARKILGEFVQKRGQSKKTVSLIRNVSLRSIKKLSSDHKADIEDVIRYSINQV